MKTAVGSVDRAFMILEFLNSSNRGWNISEMSRKLKIPKSTTHVLVSTLDQIGYIRQAQGSRRFHLSAKASGLGRRALNANPLPTAALPHLHWLVQTTQLTAHVGILEKNQVVFVQKVGGPSFIKFDTYIGKVSEIHCTGLGKALLAFLPDETLQTLLRGYVFDRFTKNTIPTKSAFLVELARIRRAGYAIDDEEEELGVRCVAVPIFSGPTAVAAVSVTGTTLQIRVEDIERIATAVKRSAARISAASVEASL
ncbi:MAG: IclR family transcriptional regulator [Acidobacteriaceae bacterium]